jgi:hypothetical protein
MFRLYDRHYERVMRTVHCSILLSLTTRTLCCSGHAAYLSAQLYVWLIQMHWRGLSLEVGGEQVGVAEFLAWWQ